MSFTFGNPFLVMVNIYLFPFVLFPLSLQNIAHTKLSFNNQSYQ